MNKFVLPKCPYCGWEMKKTIISVKTHIYGISEKQVKMITYAGVAMNVKKD